MADLDQQGGVRAPGHAAEHLDLPGAQELEGAGWVGAQFIRGHAWPSASIGWPQKPQLGRPWATRSQREASERGGLRQREAEPGGGRRLVLAGQLLEHHHDALLGLVVLHADRADVPVERQRRDLPVALDGLDVRRQVLQQGEQVLAERRDLLLLAAQVHEITVDPAGEEEDPLAGRALGPGPEDLGLGEVVRLAHGHDRHQRAAGVRS